MPEQGELWLEKIFVKGIDFQDRPFEPERDSGSAIITLGLQTKGRYCIGSKPPEGGYVIYEQTLTGRMKTSNSLRGIDGICGFCYSTAGKGDPLSEITPGQNYGPVYTNGLHKTRRGAIDLIIGRHQLVIDAINSCYAAGQKLPGRIEGEELVFEWA